MAAPDLVAFIIHPVVHSPIHQIMLLNTCYCPGTILDPVGGNKCERQEDPATQISPRQLTEGSLCGR